MVNGWGHELQRSRVFRKVWTEDICKILLKSDRVVQNMLWQHPWIGKQWGGGELNKRVWFLYWPIHEEHGERLHIFVSSICWQLVRFCGPDKEQVSLQIQRSKGYIRVKRKTTIVYIQLHKAYWRIKGSDWKACQTEPCGQVYSSESFTKLLRK